MGKFNVMRVISDLPVGGVEKKLEALLPKLSDVFNIELTCIREKGPLSPKLEKQGIPVNLIYFKSRLHPQSLWEMARFLKRKNIHILHTHMYRPNVSGSIAGYIAKTPILISNVHNVNHWDTKRQLLMDRFLNKLRDSVILVSEEVKRDYKEKTGIDDAKCAVIYNGVNIEDFRPKTEANNLKNKLGLDKDDIVLTCIGRLVPQKDHCTLLKAARILVNKYPKLKLLIVGSGNIEEELKAFARELNLENNVLFTGRRDDIPDILGLTDISVLCSIKEGFSNAILESMASGKPVVATDVGGNGEAIINGETGFLVPIKDSNLLADKLLLLINDRKLREEMGKKGQEIVEEKFSIINMAEETKKLYFNLLKKKGLI